MPYIGSSRYKYSPYLTIHFGSTEKFIPGDAVLGSSTFSQLPAFRQAMALHLSFEESDTYIDHSPANHKIFTWGTGTLTSGACSASLPGFAEYSITHQIDEFFPKSRVYRTNLWLGTLGTAYGGITAEGDWRRLLENDFTVEGYYFNSRDLYSNGGDADFVLFNIGDEAANIDQRRILTISLDGNFMRFQVGEVSGTQVTVLSITLNIFDINAYFIGEGATLYVEPFPLGATYVPKELTPVARGANNWRYWVIEKYGTTILATITGNGALARFVNQGAISTDGYNFGALSVPSGMTTASYSVQPHISGWNKPSQDASLILGQPMRTPVSGFYHDDIRITPYARYKLTHRTMGGSIGPDRPNSDHFNYNDW